MRNQLDLKKNKKPQSSRSQRLERHGSTYLRRESPPDQMNQVPPEPEDENFDIIWSGDSSICPKKLKHYQAFSRNGTTISVYSFVFILAGEEGGHHLGYLEDMYEDYRKRKMVKVRWFNRGEEVIDLFPEAQPHELIITNDEQVLSAECIDGLATVLIPKHYNQSLAIVTQDFSDGIFMCSKQIKNNKVSPFPFFKLRGYFNQIIFSILNLPIDPNNTIQETPSPKEKEQESTGVVKVSETQPVVGLGFMGPPRSRVPSFTIGEDIELLSRDSGMRGCWFRCKILKISKKGVKVEYMDVKDAGGSGKLKEWVVAYKVAGFDKLGMRWLGRNHIRPFPAKESSNDCFTVGSAVDAWWCDGWWEGVVVGTNEENNFHVFFPGENRFVYIEKMNLRSSKDWFDSKWEEIRPKPDIVSFLSSNLKLQNLPNLGEPSGSGSGSASATKATEKDVIKAPEKVATKAAEKDVTKVPEKESTKAPEKVATKAPEKEGKRLIVLALAAPNNVGMMMKKKKNKKKNKA